MVEDMTGAHGDTTESELRIRTANGRFVVGFAKLIGLMITEVCGDRVLGELAVRSELFQPFGMVHGGVYCAVVETMASVGGAYWYGDKGTVVGVNNSTDFLHSVRNGTLYAEALPIHCGRSQQLWGVTIHDDAGRLVARGQVRLTNLATPTSI